MREDEGRRYRRRMGHHVQALDAPAAIHHEGLVTRPVRHALRAGAAPGAGRRLILGRPPPLPHNHADVHPTDLAAP